MFGIENFSNIPGYTTATLFLVLREADEKYFLKIIAFRLTLFDCLKRQTFVFTSSNRS